MPYESEMEEESETSEETQGSDKGEKKEYTADEMMEYLANEAGSVDEFKDIIDEHGWELRKKEEEEGPSADYDDIEKELGMGSKPPSLSVIRISSARKALDKAKGGRK